MNPSQTCSPVFLLLLLTLSNCDGGNILVLPYEASHWVNMAVILKALHSRGHNVTVVHSSQSWFIQENASLYHSITVPGDGQPHQHIMNAMVQKNMDFNRGHQADFQLFIELIDYFIEHHRSMANIVSSVLDDEKLHSVLKSSKFDLMLTDPCWGGGVVLAKYLNLPMVYNVRYSLIRDTHFYFAPSPISFIPVEETGFTDKMTFLQRVGNAISHIFKQVMKDYFIMQTYQPLCDKYLGPNISFKDILLEADIWLMTVDFVLEFPRPTMPNVIYMGGYQCKPANPLPPLLEDFMQSSGQHGVILMSMGTCAEHLPDDLTEEIAAAFAKLPQKVIWRHKGHRPTHLGNNTLLMDWLPQNDILGHPKTTLFIAHGGLNGLYEAIYHGVPVVGLPMFLDQPDNLVRLKERGASEILPVSSVNEITFLSAVQKVLSEPSYRQSMQRLSRLHRDTPMKPLDSAIFWIEFVMRHKGAAHLKTPGYKMSWFVYHSIDVALFLLGIVVLVMAAALMVLRCVFITLCKNKSKQD